MTFVEARRPLRALLVAVLTVALGVAVGAPVARAEGGPISLSRLAAADRFATAATIATSSFGTAATVFVARGDDPNGFADALAANYVAGLLSAPVLLTLPSQVPQPTLDALNALGASNVTILGGEGAIAPSVQQTLEGRGLNVTRLGGADRFETAANVARLPGLAAVGTVDGERTAVLSSGRSFPDALAAGGIVYARHLPQLLTEAATLPPSTAQVLSDLHIDNVIITGGTGVIADGVEASIHGMGIGTERIAGTTRYDTAAALAAKAIDALGFSTNHIEIATGESFPDALAGGSHAGRGTAATILTPKATAGGAACTFLQHRPALLDGHVFGGAAAVSDAVVTALANRCPGSPGVGAITVSGHGWGHGRGLGQFGAQGYAAEDGWSSAQILDHFYGGSTAGTIDVGSPITVRLLGFDGQSPKVTSGQPFFAGGQPVPAGGVAWFTNDAGVWNVHIAAAGGCAGAETSTAPAPDPLFSSSVLDPGNVLTNMLAVCDGAGPGVNRTYRGQLRMAADDSAALRFVNVLPMEQYLRGVVPRESPASWDADALQAQAVAARSYAMAENRYGYAKTCDTTSCQVYKGAGEGATRIESQSTDDAIVATAGVVRRMNDNGNVARTEFSSSTGGFTAGGTFSAVPDDGDDIASNPNHNWSAALNAADVANRYGVGAVQTIEVVTRTTADQGRRASMVRITGAGGSVDRTGEQFRSDWGLKSTWYSVGP